jgi:CubicO group peptidase (beta-lactamase class C family)
MNNHMNKENLKNLLEKNTGQLYGKAVCMVEKNGERIFDHSVNCDLDSVFDFASVSKIITGTMIFKLIGEGRLSLDKSLDSLFAEEPLGPVTKERFKRITIKSLLTHSSGLLSWFPFYTQKGSFWDVLEFVLDKNPGQEGTVYSDLGFMLLGEAVRSVTRLSLPQNLDILNNELGTSFCYNPKNPEHCVETERGNRIERGMCMERGLSYDSFRDPNTNMRGQVNDGNAFYFLQGVSGHAGVFGSAADILRLGELYLNHGCINGKQLIPSELVQRSAVDHGGGRGLMWDLSDIFIDGFGHTGFTGTSLYVCPSAGFVAVILTNRLVIKPAPDLRPFRMEAHKLIRV